jgi:HTH-type transcriptional regulator/antitoxin MqsA
MNCPECDGTMVHEKRDMPYSYKGDVTMITGVEGNYCSDCDEVVLDLEESRRVSAAMLAFNKHVNAGILPPEYITNVRKKLGINRREAGVVFGGGPNAFSRYESGRTNPSTPLVLMLKLLDKYPELWVEVKGTALTDDEEGLRDTRVPEQPVEAEFERERRYA